MHRGASHQITIRSYVGQIPPKIAGWLALGGLGVAGYLARAAILASRRGLFRSK
jgi:hypothetical protein